MPNLERTTVESLTSPLTSLRALEAISVLLFFLQALRVVVSVTFGIAYDQTQAGPVGPWMFASSLLVAGSLFSPVLLPLFAGVDKRRSLALLALIAVIARVALVHESPDVRFWSAIIIITAGALYLATLLTSYRGVVLPALVTALVASQALMIAGNTYDVSLRSSWLPAQTAWAIVLVPCIICLTFRDREPNSDEGGLSWVGGLAMGGILFMEISLLSLGNAMARWSDSPYTMLALTTMVATAVPLIPGVRERCLVALSPPAATLATTALVASVLIAYFYSGAGSATALILAQALVLVCLVNAVDGAPLRGSGGLQLGTGLMLFAGLTLANGIAFTYPYTTPAMRGLGWIPYMLAGTAAGLALFNASPRSLLREPADKSLWFAGVAGLAIVVSVVLIWPSTTSPRSDGGTLRVATYNIHYGYDGDWKFRLDDIARTIEENDVDVIALQEVDTGRLTSYGADDVLYLADALHMNAVYLPTVEHLTGLALLFRGDAEDTQWRLLESEDEQTGIILAELEVNGHSLHVFATWIGLSDAEQARQIQEALEFIGDAKPAVFAGDFNAEVGSPAIRAVEDAGFVDPFTVLGMKPPMTAPAEDPDERIDYTWLRGLSPQDAWVSESIASDHRMVITEIRLP